MSPRPSRSSPQWLKNALRSVLIALGSVVLLVPAWLPEDPSRPIEQGAVEILQVVVLGLALAFAIGSIPHSGNFRPISRAFAFALGAAVMGELEDVISKVMGKSFPAKWLVVPFLLGTVITLLRHRRVTTMMLSLLSRRAGFGFLASAFIILYIFNPVFGSSSFWKAALGPDFRPRVPIVCRSYLELLACYFVLVAVVSLTVGFVDRRDVP